MNFLLVSLILGTLQAFSPALASHSLTGSWIRGGKCIPVSREASSKVTIIRKFNEDGTYSSTNYFFSHQDPNCDRGSRVEESRGTYKRDGNMIYFFPDRGRGYKRIITFSGKNEFNLVWSGFQYNLKLPHAFF